MAKKTKDSNLSLEERFEQALIPNWDEPYKLPPNWCWVKLDSISEILNGYAFKSSMYTENGIRIIRITNVQDGFIEDEKPVFYPFGLKSEIEQYMLKNDDLLMSLTGNVGRVALMQDEFLPAALNQRVACLRMKSSIIITKYLFYCLLQKQFIDDCTKSAKGSAQLNMSTEWLKGYSIPIPPTYEQLRIVSQIESLFAKLDEAKEKAQEVVDGFETRKAAILHKAFSGELTAKWRSANATDSFAYVESIDAKMQHCKKKKMKKSANEFASTIKNFITSEWTYVDLDKISKLITDGEHKTPRRVDEFEGYYLLSARNIHNDLLLLDNVDYVDELEFSIISKRCNPKRNDLLVSCSGSVGRCCVIEDNNNYVMVRSAAMVSLLDGNPRFVMYMLQSDNLQEQIKRLSKQTAQANLFLGAISALIIPFPDIREQNEIVRILDTWFTKERSAKEIAETVIEQIDTMKKAILARAFRGELGTNDPTEESAVELLKSVLMGNTNQQEPQKSSKKSMSIPNHIEAALLTKLEKKIISLFYATESKVVSVDEIMSVSSKKIDIIDTLTKLEQRGILIRLNNSCYRIKE